MAVVADPEPEIPTRRRRRWPFIAAGTLGLVGGLVALWWFLWVPNWRPPLREGEQYGVDVSGHQGVINWKRVADDGITFAYIKATEGGDFVDDRFRANWREAGTVGLDRGAYHFFTLCRPGAEQARNFLAAAPPDPDALSPAVDLELVGNCGQRPGVTAVAGELDEFLRLVEPAWNRQVVLYVGDEFERRYPVRERLDRPLWHRRFLRRPDVAGWVIWQLHGYAKVAGIDGGVDLNIMRPAR